MTPILALYIDISAILCMALFLLSVGILAYGLWPDSIGQQVCFVIGMMGLATAIIWSAYSSLSPSPTPAPPAPSPYNPSPIIPPSPVSDDFAADLLKAFNGTKEEAQIIAAIHQQMAHDILFDAQRKDPVTGKELPATIKTTRDMGAQFAALQQWFWASSNTPLSKRFPGFETRCAEEMKRLGLLSPEGKSVNLDQNNLRGVAAGFYQSVSNALLKKYPP